MTLLRPESSTVNSSSAKWAQSSTRWSSCWAKLTSWWKTGTADKHQWMTTIRMAVAINSLVRLAHATTFCSLINNHHHPHGIVTARFRRVWQMLWTMMTPLPAWMATKETTRWWSYKPQVLHPWRQTDILQTSQQECDQVAHTWRVCEVQWKEVSSPAKSYISNKTIKIGTISQTKTTINCSCLLSFSRIHQIWSNKMLNLPQCALTQSVKARAQWITLGSSTRVRDTVKGMNQESSPLNCRWGPKQPSTAQSREICDNATWSLLRSSIDSRAPVKCFLATAR